MQAKTEATTDSKCRHRTQKKKARRNHRRINVADRKHLEEEATTADEQGPDRTAGAKYTDQDGFWQLLPPDLARSIKYREIKDRVVVSDRERKRERGEARAGESEREGRKSGPSCVLFQIRAPRTQHRLHPVHTLIINCSAGFLTVLRGKANT